MQKILLILIFLSSFNLFSQVTDTRFPIVDQPVLGAVNDGESTFIAGEINWALPLTGRGIEVDVDIPNYNSTFPVIEGAFFKDGVFNESSVNVAEPDGEGGWYVGGDFEIAGGLKVKNIIHINSDGSIDPDWIMDMDGQIRDILKVDDFLYVSGDFTEIKGLPKNFIAKINITDVTIVDQWEAGSGGPINTIEVVGNNLFVGGSFDQIGGFDRNNIAKISQVNGTVNGAWDPELDGTINEIVLDEDFVYVAGNFPEGLAKLNNTNGDKINWGFVNANSQCNDLSIVDDSLYVCGNFDWLVDSGGQKNLVSAAKIDKNTGLVITEWDSGITNPAVVCFSIEANDNFVFIGGNFDYIDFPRNARVAKYESHTGNRIGDWEVFCRGQINDLSISSTTNKLFISSSDPYQVGLYRNNIIKINNATGNLDARWNPNPNGKVNAVVSDDNFIYIAGEFTEVDGQPSPYITRIEKNFGTTDLSWTPNPNGFVTDIQITDDAVYCIGEFTGIGGNPQTRFLAKLNKTDGSLVDGWNPQPSNSVTSISINPNNQTEIYVGGDFTNVGGLNREYVAKLDSEGNGIATWNAQCNNTVLGIKVTDNFLYVGGNFTEIGTENRNYIARLDLERGDIDEGWDPRPTDPVTSIEVSQDEDQIYVAGNFTDVGGAPAVRLARLNGTDGSNNGDWNPAPSGPVDFLYTYEDQLYVGGRFTQILGEVLRQYLARFFICSPTETTTDVEVCDSYEYNSQTYTESQEITEVFESFRGCDSTIVINLTVNESSDQTNISETACGYFVNGSTTYTESGEYELNLLNASGCDSTVVLDLDFMTIDTTITNINDATLVANLQENVEYQWFSCDTGEDVQGANSNIFTPETLGMYALRMSFGNCSYESLCYNLINSVRENGSITQIYPNPSNGLVNITLDRVYPEVRVEIYNLLGELQISKEFSHSNKKLQLNTSLNRGTYLIKLMEGERQVGQEVLIVN